MTAPGHGSVLAGRYELVEPVGTGGMARVWSGTDLVLSRRVAIKILHQHLADDTAIVERFRNEAKASARATHPCIVGIYDTVWEHWPNGEPNDPVVGAIIMEFVDGVTLRHHLDDVGTMAFDDVVSLGADLCDALHVAHRHGLIHRDVKPSNVLISFDGDVKLADFGIATAIDGAERTHDGAVVGTASYISPEQLRGEHVDARSDLYSLGLVIFEAWCGSGPFPGEDPTSRALARLHLEPARASSIRQDTPSSFDDVISHVLDRDPAGRPESAAELAMALRRCLGASTTNGAPSLTADVASDRRSPVADRDQPQTAPVRVRVRPPRSTPVVATRRRRRLSTLTVVLATLIAGSLALLVLLAWPSRTSDRRLTVPTTLPAPRPLELGSVSTFDPFGSGTRGENDQGAPLAIDGSPDTSWRTEGYQQRDLGGKGGVGLVVTLKSRSTITSVTVSSPQQGWSGDIFVLDDPRQLNAPPPNPDAQGSNLAGAHRFDLSGPSGSAVLIWITDLGDGPPEIRLEISDIVVEGRP